MDFKLFLENSTRPLYSNEAYNFIRNFMSTGDTSAALVLADFIEERGDQFGEVIRWTIAGRQQTDTHPTLDSMFKAMLAAQSGVRPKVYSRPFTEYGRDGREWLFLADIPLNAGADAMSRRPGERRRYWNVVMGAGHTIWRMLVVPGVRKYQMLARPKRTPAGEQRRDRLSFSAGVPRDPRAYAIEHFKDVDFNQIPQNIGTYMFIVSLRMHWWNMKH
jgi:hypothetical protein